MSWVPILFSHPHLNTKGNILNRPLGSGCVHPKIRGLCWVGSVGYCVGSRNLEPCTFLLHWLWRVWDGRSRYRINHFFSGVAWFIGVRGGLQFCPPPKKKVVRLPDASLRVQRRAQGNKPFTTAMLLITLPVLWKQKSPNRYLTM